MGRETCHRSSPFAGARILKVAVTGITGFIGRFIAGAIVSPGSDVVATVRSGCGTAYLPREIKTLQLDLDSFEDDPFEQLGRPDTLVHMAWGGLPNYDAVTHLEVELPRQRRFLEACIRGGLKHLLVTGTCLEYGMREGELDEAMSVEPYVAYAKAKFALCQDLMRWRDEVGFSLAWLRIFYLYGQGQAKTSLFTQLNDAIDRGDRRFPMSPGDQVRDFMPVRQAANLIVDLAESRQDIGIVNLCSGAPVSVIALVNRWMRERQASIELDTGRYPYPDYEPFAFWGSRTKLDRLLKLP